MWWRIKSQEDRIFYTNHKVFSRFLCIMTTNQNMEILYVLTNLPQKVYVTFVSLKVTEPSVLMRIVYSFLTFRSTVVMWHNKRKIQWYSLVCTRAPTHQYQGRRAVHLSAGILEDRQKRLSRLLPFSCRACFSSRLWNAKLKFILTFTFFVKILKVLLQSQVTINSN